MNTLPTRRERKKRKKEGEREVLKEIDGDEGGATWLCEKRKRENERMRREKNEEGRERKMKETE